MSRGRPRLRRRQRARPPRGVRCLALSSAHVARYPPPFRSNLRQAVSGTGALRQRSAAAFIGVEIGSLHQRCRTKRAGAAGVHPALHTYLLPEVLCFGFFLTSSREPRIQHVTAPAVPGRGTGPEVSTGAERLDIGSVLRARCRCPRLRGRPIPHGRTSSNTEYLRKPRRRDLPGARGWSEAATRACMHAHILKTLPLTGMPMLAEMISPYVLPSTSETKGPSLPMESRQ